jgi:hypothetical protein
MPQLIENKAKRIIKIISTNWIHLLGFYLCAVIMTIFSIFNSERELSWIEKFIMPFISILFLFLTYGLAVIVAFFIALGILDWLVFSTSELSILKNLSIEWILICPICIYWAFKYEYWLWLGLSFSFLITQYFRVNTINRILADN